MKKSSNRVVIFDTTLRDGEQSPGASMNLEAKLTMARALAELGVDVLEAGFPIASNGDFEAVREVARQIEGPTIAGLARASRLDIERAWEALKEAQRARIHVFLATSAIHREHKLKVAKEEIVRRAVEGVQMARELSGDVEFSPEDASRTELDFLAEVVERVIDAGASTVNIPDTVGYATPDEFAERIRYLRENVRNIDRAVVSVHCHNDLGLAVANSLAALGAGARQVECTINGIGERAGNCSLEEIVMTLRTRSDFYGVETGIDTRKIHPASRLLSQITGLVVQRNKAIVGANAFAHEAGIHQHGVIQNRLTYEIMKPEDVGLTDNSLVLGKHSGRHALRKRLHELGYDLAPEELEKAFVHFKEMADAKKEILDDDLELLMKGTRLEQSEAWELVDFHLSSGSGAESTATVSLGHRTGRIVKEAAVGEGPVEAIFRAIGRASDTALELTDFQVKGLTSGLNRSRRGHGRGRGARPASPRPRDRKRHHAGERSGVPAGGEPRGRDAGDAQGARGRIRPVTDRTPLTLFEKLWRRHLVVPGTEEHPPVVYIDLHLIHEVTSPQAFSELGSGLRPPRSRRHYGSFHLTVPTKTDGRQTGETEEQSRPQAHRELSPFRCFRGLAPGSCT
jgi:2-isopropylmalate synthase